MKLYNINGPLSFLFVCGNKLGFRCHESQVFTQSDLNYKLRPQTFYLNLKKFWVKFTRYKIAKRCGDSRDWASECCLVQVKTGKPNVIFRS